ncbi:MAG: hypothetical protein JWR21_887 [Herminiimonas sp.]|nr:hypothetical protein [Herminiimonas sp.]
MSIETKVGSVTFTHNATYTGEVEIERGGLSVKVSMEALQTIVSDKIRQRMHENIDSMKAHEILALAASKK